MKAVSSEDNEKDAQSEPYCTTEGASVSDNHPPMIAHIIYRLDVGGLENGLVNILNTIPSGRYQHVVICLTTYTGFKQRIKRKDVRFYSLHKRKGKDIGMYFRLFHLLRKLHPDIVHTRNLSTLDCVIPAALAGVRHRIHGEHGRDIVDLDGTNIKYNTLRRFCRYLIHRYIPMSQDLAHWLRDRISVPANRITQIYNGVDTDRFHPAHPGRGKLPFGNSIS